MSELQNPSFRIAVKTRLIERDMSVTKLAAMLKVSRTATSLAINHETMFPSLKNRIREALDIP